MKWICECPVCSGNEQDLLKNIDGLRKTPQK